MNSKLMFPPEVWEAVLPSDLLEYKEKAAPRGRPIIKWGYVPEKYRPVLLTKVRDAFWNAIKEGRDTTDETTFIGLTQMGELIEFIERDPSALVEIMSLNLDAGEAMAQFMQAAFAAAEGILKESNQQGGEFDNKLVASKVRLFANVKSQVEALLKLQQIVTGGGSAKQEPRRAIGPMVPDGDEEEEAPQFFRPETVVEVIEGEKKRGSE